MNVEEAKKVAETIKRAQLNELTSVDEIVMILTADPAAPEGKEYRAGEWVPKHGQRYFLIHLDGEIDEELWTSHKFDTALLSQRNVFPTEAIAEAAKKHAEFWRAFDMADEGGKVSIWVWTTGGLHVSANDSKDSNPRWQSIDSARAWVEAHGGEVYVSEMLTKGRVFRFKWGGE